LNSLAGLTWPVIGFEGQLAPSILTKFIIQAVRSYINETEPEKMFNHLYTSDLAEIEQVHQARLFKSESALGWIELFSSYIKSQLPSQSVNGLGFFRIWGNYVCVINSTHRDFILIVQVKNDPLQLHFISQKSTPLQGSFKIYTGNQSFATYSLYSLNVGGGFNAHFRNKNIPNGSSFTISNKHSIVITKIAHIHGFEGLDLQDLKKLKARMDSEKKS